MNQGSGSISIGLLVSVLLHGWVLFGISQLDDGGNQDRLVESVLLLPEEAARPDAPPDVPEPPPPIRLGDDLGSDQSQAWLGTTEDHAPTGEQSVVDQADLALNPGSPQPESAGPAPSESDNAAPPEQASAQQIPREEDLERSTPEDRAAIDAEVEAQSAPSPASQAEEPQQAPDETDARPDDILEPESPAESPAEAPPKLTSAAPSAVPPPAPSAAGAPATGDAPGEKSDRESEGSAVVAVQSSDLSKVISAKGLKIQTVAPRWLVTTRILISPRNPTVRLTFGRSGKVLKAEFANGQSTGAEEVDRPLLDAMYRWKAVGEQLRQLPEGKPEPGLTITFRIYLSRERGG